MDLPAPCLSLERRQAIALELLAERDTLAGLAHDHHVAIQQILAWKEDLLADFRQARRRSA